MLPALLFPFISRPLQPLGSRVPLPRRGAGLAQGYRQSVGMGGRQPAPPVTPYGHGALGCARPQRVALVGRCPAPLPGRQSGGSGWGSPGAALPQGVQGILAPHCHGAWGRCPGGRGRCEGPWHVPLCRDGAAVGTGWSCRAPVFLRCPQAGETGTVPGLPVHGSASEGERAVGKDPARGREQEGRKESGVKISQAVSGGGGQGWSRLPASGERVESGRTGLRVVLGRPGAPWGAALHIGAGVGRACGRRVPGAGGVRALPVLSLMALPPSPTLAGWLPAAATAEEEDGVLQHHAQRPQDQQHGCLHLLHAGGL